MASGLAPIISKEAGSSEIITEGYNGFILENPWEAKEIARKVNLLVEDEALRRKIGLRAQKTASKYSWDKIAEETMKVYEEVATK
jgi:glycosyltransferase involved in cell wall biosynthesis